jgi:hypothetical protein
MALNPLGFFKTIDYGNQSRTFTESLLERADHYFYFGGKKAQVIPGNIVNGSQAVELVDEEQSFLKTCIKVATYFTLVLPLLFFALKVILRSLHSFHIAGERGPNPSREPATDPTPPVNKTEGDTETTETGEESPSTQKPQPTKPKATEAPKPVAPKAPVLATAEQLRTHLNNCLSYIQAREAEFSAPGKDQLKFPMYNERMSNFHKYAATKDQLIYPFEPPLSQQNVEAWVTLMNHSFFYEQFLQNYGDETTTFEQREENRKEKDAIYLCLAEAYFQLGKWNESEALIERLTLGNCDGDHCLWKIAQNYFNQNQRDQAVQAIKKMSNLTVADLLLTDIVKTYLSESLIDKALDTAKELNVYKTKDALIKEVALFAYQVGELLKALKAIKALSDVHERAGLKKMIMNEAKPLVFYPDGQLMVGDAEKALEEIEKLHLFDSSDLKKYIYPLFAEACYLQGDLLKAMQIIDQLAISSWREPFMNRVLQDNNSLARKPDGTLVIGDPDKALEAVEKLRNYEVRDLFYLMLAEDYHDQRQLVKALQVIDKAFRDATRDPFLEKLFNENNALAIVTNDKLTIGDLDEAEKTIADLKHHQVKGTFYAIGATHYFSQGNIAEAKALKRKIISSMISGKLNF